MVGNHSADREITGHFRSRKPTRRTIPSTPAEADNLPYARCNSRICYLHRGSRMQRSRTAEADKTFPWYDPPTARGKRRENIVRDQDPDP